MEKINIIKETIKELLKIMDFDGKVVVDDSNKENILVNIQTEQAGFLIGQAGANLDALQHIVRILVSKKNGQPIQFVLDVNNYRKHRIEILRELAKSIAKQALSEKAAFTLQPMSAYERRIIHLALAEYPQINTESIGQEPERRVIVKPIK
jgi:spoIIIJ-associated protein